MGDGREKLWELYSTHDNSTAVLYWNGTVLEWYCTGMVLYWYSLYCTLDMNRLIQMGAAVRWRLLIAYEPGVNSVRSWVRADSVRARGKSRLQL
eukprot:COSAG01_NODE_24303_length_783_cov_5.767544_1_plen_94_part_00